MRSDFLHTSKSGKPQKRIRSCPFEALEHRIVLNAAPIAAAAAAPGSAPLASVSYSGGVTVTSSQIITEDATIPRFEASPTITSVRSGNWTDSRTWSLGRVPTTNDRVVISANNTIQYSTQSNAHINGIEIDGSLIFSTTSNTRLFVGNLTVMPTGTLQIGTTSNPVSSQVKAELVIANQPLDLVNDPQQFGTGLIALGTVTIHGANLSQTWVRLNGEPHAGDTSLLVSGSISGWRPGSTLVLPDTRQVASTQDYQFMTGTLPPQWEQVTIDHIQGNRIYLSAPLQFNHLGAYNTSGGLELFPHVALLNRNVVIRSENPQGTRGHVFITARANVDIEYARFQDLGRTDAFRGLDNTTFDANGNVTHLGTNQDGRFAVQFSNLMGRVNSTNTGYQFQFVGNTVDGALRWAVALDNASFGLLQSNVVYNAQGAGFVTEEGEEIGNLFSNNLTMRIQGTHEDGKEGMLDDDYARGGTGFWFRRGGNFVNGNVATDSTYAGFVIDGYYDWGAVTLPNFRGADEQQPGQTTSTKLSPATTWLSNEAYGMSTYGLWAAYTLGDNGVPNQPTTLFSDLRLWNIWNAAVNAYHTSNLTFDNLLVLGNKAAQDRNDVGTTGVQLQQSYENLNLVIQNSRIEGVRTGIATALSDASTAGVARPTIIKNTTLKNYINIYVLPALDDRGGNGNALELRDDKFTIIPTLPAGPAKASSIDPPANIEMKLWANNGTFLDYTQPSTVKVYNYNQVQGDNFQVFYREQDPNFVMPQTAAGALSGRSAWTIGSPEAGLTNAQNWAKYGIATAGAVAPAGASASRPDINGLVAPLQDPSALTPTVVLVTPWNNAQISGSPPVRFRYNVNGVLPAGSRIYFVMDGGTPFYKFNDGGLFNVASGPHVLKAYIGDASGHQWPGTVGATSTFVVAWGSPAVAAALTSPTGASVSAAQTASSSAGTQASQTSPTPASLTDAAVASSPGAGQSQSDGLLPELLVPAVLSDDLLSQLATELSERAHF